MLSCLAADQAHRVERSLIVRTVAQLVDRHHAGVFDIRKGPGGERRYVTADGRLIEVRRQRSKLSKTL